MRIQTPELRRDRKLFQSGSLGLGGGEDGDIRVGVFPQGQEGVIRRSGFRGVARQRVGASLAQASQRADGIVGHHAGVVEDFLEFGCGFEG